MQGIYNPSNETEMSEASPNQVPCELDPDNPVWRAKQVFIVVFVVFKLLVNDLSALIRKERNGK